MDLGKYHLISELGKGGFGIVYEARDLSLDREVALKVLHPYLAADDEFVARFRKEAKALAKLEHPNIVPVYEFAHEEDRHFIAMRYLPGGSLSKRIARSGGLSIEETLKTTRQLIDALTYTHARGVTHCDIKPNNILFDALDNAMIADFGLARAAQTDVTAASTVLSSGAGTPSYMPPEMWEEKPITPAVDQYSLACVIYEMLTGDKLFRGDSTPGIMNKHFKPIVLPDSIPVGLRLVLRKALSKEPGERFVDLTELQKALDVFATLPINDQAEETIPGTNGSQHSFPQKSRSRSFGQKSAQKSSKPPARRPPAWLPWALLGLVGTAMLGIIFSQGKPTAQVNQTPLLDLTGAPTALVLQMENTRVVPSSTPILSPSSTPIPSSTPSPTQIPTPALGVGSTQIREIDGMEQVFVPAGTFWMGSETGAEDERPVHKVNLDAYWIDKYEVTNAQYAHCVEAGACERPRYGGLGALRTYGTGETKDYPVTQVNWNDAVNYCEWVSGRLPSEAEWEKAARGEKDSRTYPWGDDVDKYRADYSGQKHPVGSYLEGASPYGALDMAGNAAEWVQDRYSPYYYYAENYWNNPKGPDSGSLRVIRGLTTTNYSNSYQADYGGDPVYYSFDLSFTVSGRDLSIPTGYGERVGFRCASTP